MFLPRLIFVCFSKIPLSKNLSMDVRIIIAFKWDYGLFDLRNALDRDEKNEFNLYKIKQLIAMYWSLATWEKVCPRISQHCFRHTRLFKQASKVKEIDNGKKTIKEEMVGII